MTRRRASDLTVTDQFCGAGGSSIGALAAGATIRLGMNHWKVAIDTYGANHPGADVVCADIQTTDPRRFPSTDVLITSPECTNHSSAKTHGRTNPQLSMFGAEETERSRATMFDVLRFADHHEYEVIIVENVVEAAKWRLFPTWLKGMTDLGYTGHPLFLSSAFATPMPGQPPAPQYRDRMFYVWVRNGHRAPDFSPVTAALAPCDRCGDVQAEQRWKPRTKAWPLETWGKYRAQYVYTCPSCREVVEPYTYPALGAIDWSIIGERIGDRDEPLRPATMARIAKGLDKYADLPPLLIPVERGHDPDGLRARSVDEAMRSQTARLETALVESPMLVQVGGNTFEREGYVRAWSVHDPSPAQTCRPVFGLAARPYLVQLKGGGSKDYVAGVDRPLGTVCASGNHHGVVVPPTFVVRNYGGVSQVADWSARSATDPFHAITTGGKVGRDQHALVSMPFTTSYYGNGGTSPVVDAIPTVTCVDRHAIVEPAGPAPSIDDCTFRMLEPHEVGRAMAFPDSYEVRGNKRQRVRQYGNAVTPPVMARIFAAVAETF